MHERSNGRATGEPSADSALAELARFSQEVGEVLFAVQIPAAPEQPQATREKPRVYIVYPIKVAPPEMAPPITEPNLPPIKVPVPFVPEMGRSLESTEVPLPPAGTILDPLPPPPPPPVVEEAPVRPWEVGLREPKKLFSVDPRYPELAARAAVGGTVILEIVVDRSGSVSRVTVLRPAPLGMTEEAVAAVRQWRYEPSLLNGRPIEVVITVTVRFNLRRP
jgi:protein TonB